MDEPGAQSLAAKIRKFWHQRGVEPKVTVQRQALDRGAVALADRLIWVVRSNLGSMLVRAA